MKIGCPFTGDEVHLPPELLELILHHIDSRKTRSHRQHDLWACALLSKSWYSATIKHLYRSPYLTTRNFDLFTRTLCPPVGSHVRKIGLEEFVVNLDMGQIAYESTNSLTARLLRRTRLSLKSFTSPSISFSLTGLAPLSRAEQLQHLDLSNDFYDIDMSQLLRAICDLPSLQFLSFPKGVLKGAYTAMRSPSHSRWPPSLTHLQLNGMVPGNPDWWNRLVADLPGSLRTLTLNLQNTFGRPYRLDFLGVSDKTAEQVTALYVKHGTWGRIEIVIFAEVFPNLKRISLPYGHFNFEDLYHSLGQAVVAAELEYLSLVDAASLYSSEQPTITHAISMEGLDVIISRFPKLRRIEIPERYFMDFASPFGNVNLDDLQHRFHKRWPAEPESEVGVFLGPSLYDDEPSWIKQTWGIPSTQKARPTAVGN